jgi:predicted ATPase
MITTLRLNNFKNFRDAELELGPLTLLVGTNASGKSNIRDAFRFLHGIGRGYSLAEIIGARYGEGGELQWQGIRGGIREIAYRQEKSFALGCTIDFTANIDKIVYDYNIEVGTDVKIGIPYVGNERLYMNDDMIYDSDPEKSRQFRMRHEFRIYHEWNAGSGTLSSFSNAKPVLTQYKRPPLRDVSNLQREEIVANTISTLDSMRFLDLHPDAMRQPSFPGQVVLGDRGDNLSSVLHAICTDKNDRQTLLSWIQELTPLDVVDFEFPTDQIGRVLVTLVEANGQRTSAYSASDGTLRFLAMAAAMLGPESAKLYFLEELDNGIHPTRLHLLLQLIEQAVASNKIQVVATTHSPSLLRLLSPTSLEYASVVYRAPEEPSARIFRLLDLPDARRVIQEQDVANLFESGWLEDAIAFQNTMGAAA